MNKTPLTFLCCPHPLKQCPMGCVFNLAPRKPSLDRSVHCSLSLHNRYRLELTCLWLWMGWKGGTSYSGTSVLPDPGCHPLPRGHISQQNRQSIGGIWQNRQLKPHCVLMSQTGIWCNRSQPHTGVFSCLGEEAGEEEDLGREVFCKGSKNRARFANQPESPLDIAQTVHLLQLCACEESQWNIYLPAQGQSFG